MECEYEQDHAGYKKEKTVKRVLITGARSYIGTSVRNYLNQWPEDYQVDVMDLRGDTWSGKSFAEYDSIFHVAGIAHQDSGKISQDRREQYFSVNTKLCASVAEKARDSGVKQFIFMSSMSVYRGEGSLKQPVFIQKCTYPTPKGVYAKSKLEAENLLEKLQNKNFAVCILRPPMIYGKGCKGNYRLLSKWARTLPFFPDMQNERSMLYVGNLCTFVKFMIDDQSQGLFFPQNAEYVSTSKMVVEIANVHGKAIHLTRVFNGILSMLSGKVSMIDKAFGNLMYDKNMSTYGKAYQLTGFLDSIIESELL